MASADGGTALEALGRTGDVWMRILDSTPDAMVVVAVSGLIVYANRQTATFFGHEPGEFLGHPLSMLLPERFRAAHEQHFRRYVDAPRPRAMGQGRELLALRKDGSEIPVDVSLSPVEGQGQRLFVAAIRDVSARVEQERARSEAQREAETARAELRALIDGVPDFVVSLDREGKVRLTNRAISGLAQSDANGKAWVELVAADQREAARAELEAVLAGTAATPRELRVRDRFASGREYACRIGPVAQEQRITGAVVVARDITEQIALEAQLATSERMASMGLLAAGVAHEINNPLAAVVSNLSFALSELSKSAMGSEVEPALREASEAAERVRVIVRDLRVFSRSEAEKSEAVDVQQVLGAAIRMAKNEIRHRAVLTERYAQTPPVLGSETRLGQVFLNLLINAAQSIPAGHVMLNEICVSSSVAPDGFVAVEFRDTGSGMSDETRAKLFQPFFTTKPSNTGTGLGLAICAKVMADLGGRIEVESALGKGSTFRLLLPQASEAPRVTPPRPGPVPVAPARRGRILIIDDEPVIVAALRRVLVKEHEVLSTHSIHEALDLIRRGESFDVILCDLMMPEGTGDEFHAKLGRTHPGLVDRIVFLTGGTFSGPGADFLARLNNRCISKPFDPFEIRALINERLR